MNKIRKKEIEVVKALGDTIGYGHLMNLASALWRQKMREENLPISGAFVPAISFFLEKGSYKKMVDENSKHYDKIVEKNIRYKLERSNE